MFAPERYAQAFIDVIEEKDLDEGLETLKILLGFAEKLEKKGPLSGKAQGKRLERVIRTAVKGCTPGGEYACRLVVLLVERRCFTARNSRMLLRAVEDLRNKSRNIVTVILDASDPPDEAFLKSLGEALKRSLGASEINLIPRIIPELLGGYRLHIGSRLVDASLRFLLKNMAAHLHSIPPGTGDRI
ncbi:MAG: F0F1 ATP synthase subunit delta [Spirochaetaceae bacterium]|jgi:F-type H+-transporting ATPase subunit delta|nr:F0F1 ATP synthase subunit delta [Spirochaetaceae bacterium]